MIKGRGHFSPLRQNCPSSSWISTRTFLTPQVSLDDGSLTLGVSRMDGLTQRPSPLWFRVSVSLEIHSSESGAWNLNDFLKTPVWLFYTCTHRLKLLHCENTEGLGGYHAKWNKWSRGYYTKWMHLFLLKYNWLIILY